MLYHYANRNNDIDRTVEKHKAESRLFDGDAQVRPKDGFHDEPKSVISQYHHREQFVGAAGEHEIMPEKMSGKEPVIDEEMLTVMSKISFEGDQTGKGESFLRHNIDNAELTQPEGSKHHFKIKHLLSMSPEVIRDERSPKLADRKARFVLLKTGGPEPADDGKRSTHFLKEPVGIFPDASIGRKDGKGLFTVKSSKALTSGKHAFSSSLCRHKHSS